MDDIKTMHDVSPILQDELIVLKEVYYKELKVTEDAQGVTILEVDIKPNTCDDIDKQLIRLLLRVTCRVDYPSVPPVVDICQPRGMTEEETVTLKRELESLAVDKTGDPMLYDIILHAKEVVTDQNIPHTLCCICLDSFTSENELFKTPEFHYFHNQCIANYVRYETEKHERLIDELISYDHYQKDLPDLIILCPLCRNEEIKCSKEFVLENDIPFETVTVEIPEEWKEQSRKLQRLFERQLKLAQASEAKADSPVIDIERKTTIPEDSPEEGTIENIIVKEMNGMKDTRRDYRHDYRRNRFYERGAFRSDGRENNGTYYPQVYHDHGDKARHFRRGCGRNSYGHSSWRGRNTGSRDDSFVDEDPCASGYFYGNDNTRSNRVPYDYDNVYNRPYRRASHSNSYSPRARRGDFRSSKYTRYLDSSEPSSAHRTYNEDTDVLYHHRSHRPNYSRKNYVDNSEHQQPHRNHVKSHRKNPQNKKPVSRDSNDLENTS